ncbi:anti-sigma factor [Pullulanibacillus sp. KACC 23026]|uniref:anti-sigma factor family protein n=1 Tax=Pullulanibacillus sp. KACC 23026 TaxID=3028315 RepID=UPI0023B08E1D|nr:anti-sigma factor [Pullulanibacillus sp. KACC 23026]WEG11975.1 anti-sigma factor [Pullulanibacillus sp. KACC 23026]
MTHHVEDLLNAYIDGELSLKEEEQVEQHLATCSECRDEHRSLLEVKEWTIHLYNEEPVPDFLSEKIMSEIQLLQKASHQLEAGIGVIFMALISLFVGIHPYFNHGLNVLVVVYRMTRSVLLALPQLVGFPLFPTISVMVSGAIILGLTLPILWKLLRSMTVEERRGW